MRPDHPHLSCQPTPVCPYCDAANDDWFENTAWRSNQPGWHDVVCPACLGVYHAMMQRSIAFVSRAPNE